MNINLFDFELPEELIAQRPSEKRDCSRLLLIDKEHKTYQDKVFHDIIDPLHLCTHLLKALSGCDK